MSFCVVSAKKLRWHTGRGLAPLNEDNARSALRQNPPYKILKICNGFFVWKIPLCEQPSTRLRSWSFVYLMLKVLKTSVLNLQWRQYETCKDLPQLSTGNIDENINEAKLNLEFFLKQGNLIIFDF